MKAIPLPLIAVVILLAVNLARAQNSKEAGMALAAETQKLQYASFANADQFKWAPLVVGADIYGTTDRYQWEEVPDSFQGGRFLVLPHHSGNLNFKVQTGGLVYMVTTTRWGSGGNASGNWKDEVLLEKDLRRKGWKRLRSIKDLSTNDTGEMAVFYRYCESGETHRIRTEKYAAPMLLIR